MKAITEQLHAALIQYLGAKPMAEVEGLVNGLRLALVVPKAIAEDLTRSANAARAEAIQREVVKLAPPAPEPNGKADEPAKAPAADAN